MISSSEARAATIGPAAAPALAPGITLRVYGVFASTVNLRADGTGDLVSLTGPRGAILPHAIALEAEPDLAAWDLLVGAPALLTPGALELPRAAGGEVRVDLTRARLLPHRPLPRLAPLAPGAAAFGATHAACVRRLAELQAAAGTDLRIEAAEGRAAPGTALGASLSRAAHALAAAGPDPGAARAAVAPLLGLGPGLTPAGDDFLSGWLAAARAAVRAEMAGALAEAIESGLGRTTALSEFLLRCALRGFWPAPLLDLAGAIAGGREDDALAALEALCAIGHSSGADLATGFLMGLRG